MEKQKLLFFYEWESFVFNLQWKYSCFGSKQHCQTSQFKVQRKPLLLLWEKKKYQIDKGSLIIDTTDYLQTTVQWWLLCTMDELLTSFLKEAHLSPMEFITECSQHSVQETCPEKEPGFNTVSMSYVTIKISSLASNTRSSAYFTLQITCFILLKTSKPSRTSLVQYLSYKMNKSGDKQQPFLTPLPVFTLLVTCWSNNTSTHWSMYSFAITLLSHQLILVFFRICINWVQCTVQCLLSVYEASTNFIIHVQNSSWHYSWHCNCISSSFSSPISKLILSKYILNFLFNPSSKYPCYHLCCRCHEDDNVMVAAFCR